MITQHTPLSELPQRYKLIAYCYTCGLNSPVDHEEHPGQTVLEITETMNCPACQAGNMGIRPVLLHNRQGLTGLFLSWLSASWKRFRHQP
jgi:hypothetical protein